MFPKKFFVADWHMDVLSTAIREGHDIRRVVDRGDVDLPRLREANFKLCGWSLWWDPRSSLTPAQSIKEQIALAKHLERKNEIKIVRSKDDLKTIEAGPLHVLLHLEGCQCFEEEDKNWFYEAGVRSLSLTWNEKNVFATGTGSQQNQSEVLTSQGKDLVKWCRERGVVLDISHLSEGGMRDVFACDDEVVVATHANCRALKDHVRNLSDETIKEISSRGGAVGVTLVPGFISDKRPCEEVFFEDHIHHLHVVGGEQVISLGSDLDGTELPPFINDLNDITEFLLRVSEKYGEGLWGSNMTRVLRRVLPD